MNAAKHEGRHEPLKNTLFVFLNVAVVLVAITVAFLYIVISTIRLKLATIHLQMATKQDIIDLFGILADCISWWDRRT